MRELATGEITALLEGSGLGVLAFDGGEHPYPIPVAFGYDPTDERLVLQLAGGDDSEKKQYLKADSRVGFTVYEETGPGEWQSVLVRGELVEIAYADAEAAFAALARNTQGVPSPMLWGGLSANSEVTPYELRIAELSGREYTTGSSS